MASQLAMKAVDATKANDQQLASEVPQKVIDAAPEDDASKSKNPQEVRADVETSTPSKQRSTSAAQKMEPDPPSQNPSLDLAAELQAQEVDLQQLRDTVEAKQRQIDDLHKEVSALKESIPKKDPSAGEAFLEKSAITSISSEGDGAQPPEGKSGSGEEKSGGEAEAGDKKSGSLFTAPSTLSFIVIAGFTVFESIVA